jgi:hypothetical protein
MSYNPQNPNGSATSANSAPVVIASDQSAVSTTDTNSSTIATNTGNAATNTSTIAGAVSSSKMNVVPSPVTSGGLSVASGNILATATAIKSSAGQVYGWFIYNNNSTQTYVQFYNSTTGSTTVGTAVVFAIGIPANSGANVTFPIGITFSTAITIAAATVFHGNTGPTNFLEYNIFYN